MRASVPLDWREVLRDNERLLAEILLGNGDAMARDELERACLARGMNRVTFYLYIENSPIMARYRRGVYGLRGA